MRASMHERMHVCIFMYVRTCIVSLQMSNVNVLIGFTQLIECNF